MAVFESALYHCGKQFQSLLLDRHTAVDDLISELSDMDLRQ